MVRKQTRSGQYEKKAVYQTPTPGISVRIENDSSFTYLSLSLSAVVKFHCAVACRYINIESFVNAICNALPSVQLFNLRRERNLLLPFAWMTYAMEPIESMFANRWPINQFNHFLGHNILIISMPLEGRPLEMRSSNCKCAPHRLYSKSMRNCDNAVAVSQSQHELPQP